jgi:hypothetical protein
MLFLLSTPQRYLVSFKVLKGAPHCGVLFQFIFKVLLLCITSKSFAHHNLVEASVRKVKKLLIKAWKIFFYIISLYHIFDFFFLAPGQN